VSQAVEFVIDERHQLLKGLLVSRTPSQQQTCHVMLLNRGGVLGAAIHLSHTPSRVRKVITQKFSSIAVFVRVSRIKK
jgi:hypothetical protein